MQYPLHSVNDLNHHVVAHGTSKIASVMMLMKPKCDVRGCADGNKLGLPNVNVRMEVSGLLHHLHPVHVKMVLTALLVVNTIKKLIQFNVSVKMDPALIQENSFEDEVEDAVEDVDEAEEEEDWLATMVRLEETTEIVKEMETNQNFQEKILKKMMIKEEIVEVEEDVEVEEVVEAVDEEDSVVAVEVTEVRVADVVETEGAEVSEDR